MTDADIIRDLIAQFDNYRGKWIAKRGSDSGFNEWFTQQVLRATEYEAQRQLVEDHEGIYP